MPAPDTSTPAVPREELLRRLHERQKLGRGGGGIPASVPGSKAVERATQAALSMSPVQLKKMEALLEECGGNIALFCERSGVDAAFLPSIEKAVKSISSGTDQKTAISTAAAEVVALANTMRAP